MPSDRSAQLGIDAEERLFVVADSATFPLVHRQAMAVHWEDEQRRPYSSRPREWSYLAWYAQIVKAAKLQSGALIVTADTEWVDIPDEPEDESIAYQAGTA